MLSRLETCLVYSCIWSVTLAKSIFPRKTWRKLWHSYISKLFLTKMQVTFSIFFHHGSLNVIGDKFRFVRSKLWNITFILLKTRRQEPTGRGASVREFITRQTCKTCDYTVDYMCRTKTSKSPHAFAMCGSCAPPPLPLKFAKHMLYNVN
jgi:hypothetical protein